MESGIDERYSGTGNRKLRHDRASGRGAGVGATVTGKWADPITWRVAAIEAGILIEDSHGPTRSLVKDGVWQVPASERPKGWEKMGLREI